MASTCWKPDSAPDQVTPEGSVPPSREAGCAGVKSAGPRHDTAPGPVLLPEAAGIHLRRTLDSGQAFRWRWQPGPDHFGARNGRERAWGADGSGLDPGTPIATGVVGRRVFHIAQDARGLWLRSPTSADALDALRSYLGVGPAGHAPRTTSAGPPSIRRVEAALSSDRTLARLLPHTSGIILLAQDPWEVLISFIVSQNNNIPKIGQSIERMARALGEPLDGSPRATYAFPSPERLAAAHPRTLRWCLLGYRAPYVRAAACLVAEGRLDLAALQRAPVDEARETLLQVPGVGEKVGDCILLFGLRHTTAFPVDVWVRRAVERLYFRGRPRTLRQIRAFAEERFGPLAGYAQQHLYAYARAHLR
jgi:N-glycosylase/DNA lyase